MSLTKEFAEELWEKADNFLPSELEGKYKVTMVGTFTFPFHIKVFDHGKDEFYNRICGIRTLEFGILVTEHCVEFLYGILGMYDKVKRVCEGYYIGKFYKRDKFVAYFALEKI